MMNLFRKKAEPEPEVGDKPADQAEPKKLHLRELEGGERVLQLWANFKAERAKEPRLEPTRFNNQISSFLYSAMEALVEGHAPKVPVVEPDQPSWMKGKVQNGSVDHRRRILFSRGWTEEQIAAVPAQHYHTAILANWTPEQAVQYAAEQQAKRDAELEKRKKRWPNKYK